MTNMGEGAPRYTTIGGLTTAMGKNYAFRIFIKLPNGKFVNAYAMPNKKRRPEVKTDPEYNITVIDNPDSINESTGEADISNWYLPHE